MENLIKSKWNFLKGQKGKDQGDRGLDLSINPGLQDYTWIFVTTTYMYVGMCKSFPYSGDNMTLHSKSTSVCLLNKEPVVTK